MRKSKDNKALNTTREHLERGRRMAPQLALEFEGGRVPGIELQSSIDQAEGHARVCSPEDLHDGRADEGRRVGAQGARLVADVRDAGTLVDEILRGRHPRTNRGATVAGPPS